jgi:hypothetical protein
MEVDTPMNMGTHPVLNKECTDEVHMDVVDLEGEDIVVIVEVEAVTKKEDEHGDPAYGARRSPCKSFHSFLLFKAI